MKKARNLFYSLIASILMLSFSLTNVYAIQAVDKAIQFKQPSGETFYAYMRGDDEFNWVVTQDTNTVIIQKDDNYWYYAILENGEIISSNVKYKKDYKFKKAIDENDLYRMWNERKSQINLINSLNLNKSGLNNKDFAGKSHDILVLLIEFNDINMTFSEKNWSDAMFSSNTKSVSKYYREVSNNSFDFKPAKESYGTSNDGVIKIRLNYNHPNTNRRTGSRNVKVVSDSLKLADQYIDFKQYDKNNNGQLDSDELHIVTVLAGYEASGGAGYPSIWAHKWAIWGNYKPTLDGISIPGPYTQQGELHGQNKMASIGVLCHELGHSLGLPDLYDTTYRSSGIGIHSIMAGGSWGTVNQQGDSPTHFDAWSKTYLNFVDPTLISKSGTYTVNSSSTGHPNILKVPTKKSGEYFLIENRSFDGFDEALENGGVKSAGIAIWHIDENVISSRMASNSVNNCAHHKGVDIEEANEGKLGYSQLDNRYGGDYDHYYYLSDDFKTFGSKTNPSSKLYSGEDSGIKITVNSKPSSSMNVSIDIGDGVVIKDQKVKVTGIKLNTNSTQLIKGKSLKLEANVFPQNATNKKINWSTNNELVAKVDENGNVLASAPGKATIYATTDDGLFSGACLIVVKDVKKDKPQIKLDKDDITLKIGESKQINAVLLNSKERLIWSSSNNQVAKVDQNGNISALSKGKATITVSTSSRIISSQCIINVVNNSEDKKVNRVLDNLPSHNDIFILKKGNKVYAYSRDYLVQVQRNPDEISKDFYEKVGNDMKQIYFKLDNETYKNYNQISLTEQEINSIEELYYYDENGKLIKYTKVNKTNDEINKVSENVLDYVPVDNTNFIHIEGSTAYAYDRSYLVNNSNDNNKVYKDFYEKAGDKMAELYYKYSNDNYKNYNNNKLSKEEIESITHLLYYDEQGNLHEYIKNGTKITQNSTNHQVKSQDSNNDSCLIDTKSENLLDCISIDRNDLIFIEKDAAYIYNRTHLTNSQRNNGKVYQDFIDKAGYKMNELYSKFEDSSYINYDRVKMTHSELQSITTAYYYDKFGNLNVYKKK